MKLERAKVMVIERASRDGRDRDIQGSLVKAKPGEYQDGPEEGRFGRYVSGVGSRQGGGRPRMRNVVRLRIVGQSSGTAGYDGSSESSSSSDSSESESDSNFEDENVVESSESSHETGSSEFEEAEVLEEIEEESDHLEHMNIFQGVGVNPQASSDSYDYLYGYGNELWEDMEISSSDVEIIEPPPPEIIDISSDSTVAVNIIDVSSRETSPWIAMPAWSPVFSLGGSLDFSMESIGQSFDPYYEYHYSAMPMESSPTNQEAGTEAVGVDVEVQQETRREDQMVEGTQNGMTRTSGTLRGTWETMGMTEDCALCGLSDHRGQACPRVRNQPELSRFAVCTSCTRSGHFVADCPMTSLTRAVPITVVPPTSPARSTSSATGGSNHRNLDLSRSPDDGARGG
ncbi:hypothetical protein Bca4012_064092 [Brassica carinata]